MEPGDAPVLREFQWRLKIPPIKHQRGAFLVPFPDLADQGKAMGSIEGASGSWSHVCFQTCRRPGASLPSEPAGLLGGEKLRSSISTRALWVFPPLP